MPSIRWPSALASSAPTRLEATDRALSFGSGADRFPKRERVRAGGHRGGGCPIPRLRPLHQRVPERRAVRRERQSAETRNRPNANACERPLKAIAGDAAASTTAAGSSARLRHWGYYVAEFHPGCTPGTLGSQDVHWPPSRDEWIEFLNELRPRLKSFMAFKNAVENICSVGRQMCSKRSDPRALYRFEHDRTMRALLRHYGQNNTFVPALDMHEAHNGPNYIDRRGLAGAHRGDVHIRIDVRSQGKDHSRDSSARCQGCG